MSSRPWDEVPPADRLTAGEAAAYLGLSITTLQDWRYRGIGVASRKEGRRVYYDRADLEHWMAMRR
ncbi:helix-turn-helix domain-containing protein [Actinospica sp. MGRD01-02]|uniref:Helix-turn-helix domain-containing protein n=1 Tax=Actinospica acidithermotolerans TaxID=2828514 RepID=A0A941EFP3_9ACTN|nr:helix-turn-helix domain-containing protein [Actinospica acidithermotolerans]MBR7828234.1 helix-turn-helix domain-containing protein [Actinospica acidithermotolerans]